LAIDLASRVILRGILEEATPSRARRPQPHGIRRCGGPESPWGSEFCAWTAARAWRAA